MANTSMPETEITDLHVPFEVDKLLEVRTARMKRMPGLKTPTAIDKTICPEPMKVGKLGLEGDEHDLTFHGGPDKAILGCKQPFQASPEPPLLTKYDRLFDSLPALATGAPRKGRPLRAWRIWREFCHFEDERAKCVYWRHDFGRATGLVASVSASHAVF